MKDIRYPEQFLDYRPMGRKRPGRLLKETTGRIKSWGRNRSNFVTKVRRRRRNWWIQASVGN